MDFLEMLSVETGRSKKEISHSLEELKHMGYLITDEIYPNIKEVVNYRLYGNNPIKGKEGRNTITLGPFPILKEEYEKICNTINSIEEMEEPNMGKSILLFPAKYEYEHFGTAGCNEGLTLEENQLNDLAMLINYIYDINNPIFTNGDIYWIVPKIELREKIFLKLGIPKDKEKSAKWWDIKINMSENSIENIKMEYKSDCFMIPSSLDEEWSDFITDEIMICIFDLYMIGTRNNEIINIRQEEIYMEIEKYIDNIHNNSCINPDKAILLQRLYKLNDINIPTTVPETLEFIMKLGFLIKVEDNIFKVADLTEIKKPEEVFKIRDKWKRELKMYKKNNSIIYNFISPKQYLELTSK